MISFEKINGFDWDEGNIKKNLIKHGVSCQEAEEVFLDINAIRLEDNKHSLKEQRFASIGKIISNKILIVFFTIRKNKIRIISVRDVNKKEKNLYLG